MDVARLTDVTEVLAVRLGRGAAGFHQLLATLQRKRLAVRALVFAPAEAVHEVVVAVEAGARPIGPVVAAINGARSCSLCGGLTSRPMSCRPC